VKSVLNQPLVLLLAVLVAGSTVLVPCGSADKKSDYKVGQLPGLKVPLQVNHYAGYIQVDKTHDDQLFFWLFESRTAPRTDPLVIWLSGGPGCSSISALFEENGPLRIKPDLTLTVNPQGWNQRANIIYIDQPVGTGLSYSGTDHLIDRQYDISAQFYAFLRGFYSAFPEYKQRKLYLTGESYAGHMIPCIARYILERNGKPGQLNIPLAGLAIGNGWVDPRSHIEAAPTAAFALGLIDRSERDAAHALYRQTIKAGVFPRDNTLGTAHDKPKPIDLAGLKSLDVTSPYRGISVPKQLQGNPQVKAMVARLEKYKGQILAVKLSCEDFIALIDLLREGGSDVRKLMPPIVKQIFGNNTYQELTFAYLIARVVSYTGSKGSYVNLMDLENYGPTSMIGTPTKWPGGCEDFGKYLSQKTVQRALHAEKFPGKAVEGCNPLVYLLLNSDYYKSSLYLIPGLLQKLPILFYNGQMDLICNQAGTLSFLHRIARDPKRASWPGKQAFTKAKLRPWSLEGKRVGYYKTAGNLQFLNVLGASHMVPLSKPKVALALLNRFIHRR